MELIKLNTFIKSSKDWSFGDIILFQEYERAESDYKVSKPILAVYLGYFVADQTIGFNYAKWVNPNHTVYISNEHVKNYPACPQAEIKEHVEWSDYINVLGHWKSKPNWKEILKAYRTQNTKELVTSKEINWE